ncbi:MbeD/MobD family mobilization/exclusion protein [Salmonella enterica]|uniref:Uncharacterized protein n=1 Tax=Salmonella enterica subsp. enterica serovar Dessau TaxID=2564349 RepID=A0A8E5MYH5_SALET|nr:MbeD/MobD family mobilization/exclusion protein [Salmonella enterica]QUS46993.1 hypothetical protein F1331_24085 [Salmonella enterica subsp. enterica serovar Dessau]
MTELEKQLLGALEQLEQDYSTAIPLNVTLHEIVTII